MQLSSIIAISPFEKPDVALLAALLETTAFPVMHLGRDAELAQRSLNECSLIADRPFGICVPDGCGVPAVLPSLAGLLILPWGTEAGAAFTGECLYQVCSMLEAREAKNAGYNRLILKGNESGGKVGDESAFIFLQRVKKEMPELEVWVQGGAGVYTGAAILAMGAQGLVIDSQLALFPECSAPKGLKQLCEKLNGTETRVLNGRREFGRPGSIPVPEDGNPVLGQDIAFAGMFVKRYGKVKRLILAMEQVVSGHLRQAKAMDILGEGAALAVELKSQYPIAQGPMTRVSDVPAFAAAVAEAGGLPFVALSLMKGDAARKLLEDTRQLLGAATWGVGILGFTPQELREEQLTYIKEIKPPLVIIAGGRASQAALLEKLGIKTFLHAPVPALLDMFLKEGANRFIFEGRECGGHVGPLSSLVLWELQVNRLLQEEQASRLNVLFAGGIHDEWSAAFVSVMAAPLAARGAKVGVLMGTAYLYTKEAVETGAILQQFQDQALAHTDTVLLETAPGHETRCLLSPFAEQFEQEKARLVSEGIDKKAIWERLEGLNVGRLRVASKGLIRDGNQLEALNAEEQARQGMYMIGQVTALRNEVTSMAELHRRVGTGSKTLLHGLPLPALPPEMPGLDVAIVGMACVYPDAANLDEFWKNILLAKDCITEVPDERWNKAVYYDGTSSAGDKSPSKWGGFIPKIDFDPLEFGIPPQSLAAIDPTQLLSLLVAKRALEDAGYAGGDFNGDEVSVIIAAEGGNDLANNYGFRALFPQLFGSIPAELDETLPRLTEDSFPGVLANVIAGRITNRLNLGGRNYTVDAACASSLAAVDLACQELILGKADMVLAGAADLHNGINDYLMFASTHALSRKGRCATFDHEADGIALGEGVAMLILKRRKDAIKDGDRIYAVIQGVGGSSDGKSLGLTAPRRGGQVKALERAYTQAGFSAAEVTLLEAHGTGTVVGDRTELSALSGLWSDAGSLAGQTALGSVKTQIGHTKCAAGLAGLIKAALSVYHGIKPPTLHINTPNSFYEELTSPFVFYGESAFWPDMKRRAGVSAFGFGGTNFHVVLENAGAEPARKPVLVDWPAELLVFRGNSVREGELLMERVRQLLEVNDRLSLKDLAYSLASHADKPIVCSIVASDRDDLHRKLEMARAGTPDTSIFYTENKAGKVAFLFPGQGSQRIGIARQLMLAFPEMRKWLDRYPEYAALLYPPKAFGTAGRDLQKERIKDTRVAQPLLGIVDLAIANCLRMLGIEPDMLAGHSYGELPALCFAGVFAEDRLVELSEARAQAILDGAGEDKGMMLAVNAAYEVFAPLAGEGQGIYAVNHNSPQQWVLAGGSDDILSAADRLKQAGIACKVLEVACAFHSPLLAGSPALYKKVLDGIRFTQPSLEVWSNTLAERYPQEPAAIKSILCGHLVKPVSFVKEMEQMYVAGARLFIEVGPGKVLSGLTSAILGSDERVILHTEDAQGEGVTQLLRVLGAYMATGRSLQVERLFEGRGARALSLDDPKIHQKRKSNWLVNGQRAIPEFGILPAYAGKINMEPMKLMDNQHTGSPQGMAGQQEQLLQQYLESMRQLMQAQRDVMLGYLGQMPDVTAKFPLAAPALPARIPSPAPERPEAVEMNLVIPEMTGQRPPLKELLLQIVSDKTGYPVDMLGLELDLEADLSIDSIKRMEIIAELRQNLGNLLQGVRDEEGMMEELTGLKTLQTLLNWLSQLRPPEGVPTVQPLPPRQANTVEQHPAAVSAEEIRKLLLAVVSDKTGYPEEMLGTELDLEADLSIDSIKRMEIMGEVKEMLGGFGARDEEGDGMMEQMATIKTLNGLVTWIGQMVSGGLEMVAEAKNILGKPVEKLPEQQLLRFHFEWQPADFEGTVQDLSGQRIGVFGSGDLVNSLVLVLELAGAVVRRVGVDDPLEDLQGLFLLNAPSHDTHCQIQEAVQLVKRINPETVKWLYALEETPELRQEVRQQDRLLLQKLQGFPGFLKTLGLEWEGTKCRTVLVEPELSTDDLLALLLQECRHLDGPLEVGYLKGLRHVLQQVSGSADTKNRWIPDPESVILVLGGAQGITAELMAAMAEAQACRYILVGRSSLTEEVEADGTEKETSLEGIKQQLIRSGKWTSPAAIEKRALELFKQKQLKGTLAAFEACGAPVDYHCLDVRDELALKGLLDRIYTSYGRIDAVVHAAGVLEDKLFLQKSPESFERVYQTKVAPLRVLADHLRWEQLKLLVFFSSVASVFGNKGQTDYASANSLMDSYARALNRLGPSKVMAINWGPWAGAGMVTAALERQYTRRGIALIPLPEGKAYFINEWKNGLHSQVLIMAGTAESLITIKE